ncbi:hypothetical protein EVAR_32470_1 [Eumeta japonica]|uniref:Uncharacterized protein n=1 Tax=Eumeta variegata TaxID=151549 RepID=A0A4C1VKM4_EUMVA|nr:hypothetical protein EVAR_32470_1 [Eumeta japonica]
MGPPIPALRPSFFFVIRTKRACEIPVLPAFQEGKGYVMAGEWPQEDLGKIVYLTKEGVVRLVHAVTARAQRAVQLSGPAYPASTAP